MKKDKVFNLRLTEQDEKELQEVANTIRRSKSGTLRFALHEIARVVRDHPNKAELIRTMRVE